MAMHGGSVSIATMPTTLFCALFLILCLNGSMLCNGSSLSSNVSCMQSERQALLSFKQHLQHPSNRLASWVGGDCCNWYGVVCSKSTGRVHMLLLGNPHPDFSSDNFYYEKVLWGEISPSLVELKHLRHLDLSYNDIGGARIPEFLGSLGNLRHLNLSWTRFSGMIPHQLGNLTNLHSLDLSYLGRELINGTLVLPYAKNLQWISQLSSLRYLDMSEVDLKEASDWVEATNSLPSLAVLRLRYCNLNFKFRPIYHVNFSSLSLLDLSHNYLGNYFIPPWVFNLRSLTSLHLSEITVCGHGGPIPEGIQNLTSLVHLDLSHNNFITSIPRWLYSLSHLEILDLHWNGLSGRISSEIKNLTSITTLDLSYNQLEGPLPIPSIARLCNLKEILFSYNYWNQSISQILDSWSECLSDSLQVLDIEHGQIYGQLIDRIGNFSSLRSLSLSHNQIDGNLPESLSKLIALKFLDISNNSMEGIVSKVHFSNKTELRFLLASQNSLMLRVPENWVPSFQLESLDMDSWYLGPEFPLWLQSQKELTLLSLSSIGLKCVIPSWVWNFLKLQYLDLSYNQMYGSIYNISKFLTNGRTKADPQLILSHNNFVGPLPHISPKLYQLDVSDNSLSGSISQLLCHKQNQPISLMYLNLSNNQLAERLSDCWSSDKWQRLATVDLSYNNFHGSIPSSLGSLHNAKSLYLHHNNLSGEFALFLQNVSRLSILDLAVNNLNGNIPASIGTSLSQLRILRLRFNQFHGRIPDEICAMASLQILDLAYNNLSGHIPKCFNNCSTMVAKRSVGFISKFEVGGVVITLSGIDKMELVVKNLALEYDKNLQYVTSIDLSCNLLSGQIPTELALLLNLLSLNLSNNHLTGEIPREFGQMGALESMDLSTNQLSGEIPPSMSNLSFLSYLNVSFNNLVGRIPPGPQLQSFKASSYIGNHLCGAPLPKLCSTDVQTPTAKNKNADEDEDEDEMLPSLYLGMGVGFSVGFWGVCVALFFNRTLRHKSFLLLGHINDYIYVACVLKMRWITAKFRSCCLNQ